jgi:hypothetical protein
MIRLFASGSPPLSLYFVLFLFFFFFVTFLQVFGCFCRPCVFPLDPYVDWCCYVALWVSLYKSCSWSACYYDNTECEEAPKSRRPSHCPVCISDGWFSTFSPASRLPLPVLSDTLFWDAVAFSVEKCGAIGSNIDKILWGGSQTPPCLFGDQNEKQNKNDQVEIKMTQSIAESCRESNQDIHQRNVPIKTLGFLCFSIENGRVRRRNLRKW